MNGERRRRHGKIDGIDEMDGDEEEGIYDELPGDSGSSGITVFANVKVEETDGGEEEVIDDELTGSGGSVLTGFTE